ncbi:MAG: GNAT family N-acetyltransferase [Spirochaetes bacterium]|nr:GNAT family N-acetyltransferase [Spirochaetota bacterium]
MKKQSDRIRTYVSGDESGIIPLINEVFHSSMDDKLWHWKYFLHPAGKGWINVAESGNQIVALHALMRSNLNFIGSEIMAAQPVDIAVRDDQRRKRWMVRLAQNIYDRATREGAMAIYGFPIRNMYVGVMRHLDFIRVCNLSFYRYHIGNAGLTGTAIDRVMKYLNSGRVTLRYSLNIKFSMKNVSIASVEALPDDLDEMLREINDHEVISIWKDRKYLQWRYKDHPINKYKFFSLRIGGRLHGLIVTRTIGERVAICEMLNRTKNIQQAFTHLLYIIKHYLPTGAQELFFLGHDNGYFDTVFGMSGFKKSISNVVCTGRNIKSGRFREMFMIPDNWTLVYGDTDHV